MPNINGYGFLKGSKMIQPNINGILLQSSIANGSL